MLLGAFNLLPGFPLDGGRVLRAAIWAGGASFRTATRWASNAGHALAFGFVLIGVGQVLSGRVMDRIWVAFLGWFLNNAAEASYQQVAIAELMTGVSARDLMVETAPCVSPHLTLDQLVHDYVLLRGEPSFLVAEDDVVLGAITLQRIKAVPRERWQETPTADAMTPLSAVPKARADDGVPEMLRRMEETGVDQLPVVEAGRLSGVVTREHLVRFLRTRSELQV